MDTICSHPEKAFYLTIVRHGQTSANVSKIIQGHSNTPLTSLGIEQAKALAKFFKLNGPNKFDRIYSSDLERAYETCKIIVDICSDFNGASTIIKDCRLRERKYGHLFEGRPIALLQAQAYNSGYSSTNFTQYSPEGVESMEGVRARVETFCKESLWNSNSNLNFGEILIVTHWATIKEFLKLFQSFSNGAIRKEHLVESPNVAFSRFKIHIKKTIATNGACDAEKNDFKPEIQVICLHQTPHLSLEQSSVNIKEPMD